MRTKGLLIAPGALLNDAVQHKITIPINKPYDHHKGGLYIHPRTRMTVRPGRFGLLRVDLEDDRRS